MSTHSVALVQTAIPRASSMKNKGGAKKGARKLSERSGGAPAAAGNTRTALSGQEAVAAKASTEVREVLVHAVL